jgi:hypothetical protein
MTRGAILGWILAGLAACSVSVQASSGSATGGGTAPEERVIADASAAPRDAGDPEDAADAADPDAGPAPEPATFNPPSGASGNGALCVTLTSATPGATIHYTLDGSTPTISSPTYIEPLAVEGGVAVTLRTLTVAPGFPRGAAADAQYTFFHKGYPFGPMPDPAPGAYSLPLTVHLTYVVPRATVCYTLDRTEPSCTDGTDCYEDVCGRKPACVFTPGACTGGSLPYDDAGIVLEAPTDGGFVTLRTIACPGSSEPSVVLTADYTQAPP